MRRLCPAVPAATLALFFAVAGCANAERGQYFIPLDAIAPAAGPIELGEGVDDAPQAIMSAVIAGDLLVGGQSAARLAEGATVMPASGEAAMLPEADDVTRAAPRQAAFERLTTEQREARLRQAEQTRLLEHWMRTRVTPVPMSRADIRQVQERLTAAGFDPGPADGIVGPRTQAAVERFEGARRLPMTGEVTPGLLDLLTILN